MSQYDPGEPYEGPPPRRRRRRDYKRESEYDDAWAAANEDALDGDLAIEELAAGYAWEDRDRYGVHHDDHDEEPGAGTGTAALPRPPRRARRPYTRGSSYTDSRTYHRDQARRSEYAEYHDSARAPQRSQHAVYQKPAVPRRGVPYWQILILVILALFAVLAVTLACVSLLTLA